jgi:hypothetical protein
VPRLLLRLVSIAALLRLKVHPEAFGVLKVPAEGVHCNFGRFESDHGARVILGNVDVLNLAEATELLPERENSMTVLVFLPSRNGQITEY